MNNGLIAVRYATALLDFSNNAKVQALIYQEAKKVSQNFIDLAMFKSILDNPVLDILKKKEVILLAAGGKVTVQFERFIDLVLENKRELYLKSILIRFIDLYRKQNNIFAAKLTSASDLDSPIEGKLVAAIEQHTGGTVELQKFVDSYLIGGFLVEVDNSLWNASVSAQLEKLRLDYIEINKSIL